MKKIFNFITQLPFFLRILAILIGISSSFARSTPSITCWTKLIKLPETGAYANYWCDSRLQYDISKGEVILFVDGWVSKKEKLAGSQPITQKNYLIPDSVNPQLGMAGKAFLSGYVKAQPEFSGSTADQE